MADVSEVGMEWGDLLLSLKRAICDSLKTVEGLDERRIDSCCLKVNKKLKSGDLIVPAFVRTCVGDQLNSKDINNVGLSVVLSFTYLL